MYCKFERIDEYETRVTIEETFIISTKNIDEFRKEINEVINKYRA